MAHIAMVVSEKGHASTPASLGLLTTTLGHTVEVMDHAEAAASDFSGFDLIAINRFQSFMAGYSDALASVISAFNSGVPILCGYGSANSQGAVSTDSVAVAVGVADRTDAFNGRGPNIYLAQDHPIISNAGLSAPGTVQIWNNSTFMEIIPAGANYVGVPIANQSQLSPENLTMVAADRGAISLLGSPFPAKFVFMSILYGNAAYANDGAALVGGAIQWAITPSAYLLGSVRDDSTSPLERPVHAYLRSTGQRVGSATSDAAGQFQIFTPYPEQLHYVVALDEESGAQNALIKDRIIPYLQ